jgi:hypothetical protein
MPLPEDQDADDEKPSVITIAAGPWEEVEGGHNFLNARFLLAKVLHRERLVTRMRLCRGRVEVAARL